MPKILLVSPDTRDASSFYRCVGPWSYAAKVDRKNIQIEVLGDGVGARGVTWDTISQFDLVFLQRPCREDDLTLIKVARNVNVPVWVDIDDWLFGVPWWNTKAHEIFSNPYVQQVIAACIGCADIVSTSTEELRKKLSRMNENVCVVPNAYRDDLYPYVYVGQERKSHYAWRGGSSHDKDLFSVAEAWGRLNKPITFFGKPSWLILEQVGQLARVVPQQDNFLYMKQLYDCAPRVMLVPLVDDEFNRCKSNIAYIEAMHAGAICVAPDMPEWQRSGVVRYKPGDSEDFIKQCKAAIECTFEMEYYSDMLSAYGASNVNKIRMTALNRVLSSVGSKKWDPYDPGVGFKLLNKLSTC